MKLVSVVSICIAAAVAQPAFADQANHSKAESIVVAQAAPLTDAEIRKIDKEAKKITLKHAPIANLDMPAMTMVFQVADPAMLDKFKAGDKVRFAADKSGGGYTVTKIEPQK
jgi:Cu(I)/Ag(I) efflux system protein CusF